ncbi:MAG: cysteine rich repeat-containing protein [Elusimicrobiota bacterium]|nr:cysteine rich repeat-containing protein [Elusimicrobiota bacterium]
MIRTLTVVLLFAASAHAKDAAKPAPEGKPGHEAKEDKARTVPGGASKGVKACHADLEKFCKGVKPGEGRQGACLKANAKKLSKSCRAWASHGGKGHMDEALGRDIDGAPAVVPDAAPAPQPAPAGK